MKLVIVFLANFAVIRLGQLITKDMDTSDAFISGIIVAAVATQLTACIFQWR